jgi:hypothetical protein
MSQHVRAAIRHLGAFASAGAICVAGSCLAGDAHAGGPSFGPNDVQTVFYISKSRGRNRVDYGMRLDAACAPSKREAVFPYWRQLEYSPYTVSPLKLFETAAYGVERQGLQQRTSSGSEYALQLKHVDRPIWVTTTRSADGTCTARARTRIGSVQNAELRSIFVQLSGPVSVTYIDVKGKDPRTGAPLEERITR